MNLKPGLFPLEGMVDVHSEAAEVAFLERASSEGLRAVVLKWPGAQDSAPAAMFANHFRAGSGTATVRFFGGVVLDRAVGGLNVAAVEACAAAQGMFVWLPVKDALTHRLRNDLSVEGAVHVVDPAGQLVPEMHTVLECVAAQNMILGTGHLGPAEVAAVVPAALGHGVQRILLNHPLLLGFSLDDLPPLAHPGVFFEHCYTPNHPKPFDVGLIAKAVDALGAERSLIGDFGLFGVQPNVADALIAWGMPQETVRRLAYETPAKLLQI